ncbi:hypothetical protein ACFRAA_33300 [[Kitasatospora] papulosa]|uniref:hypothetical protein n=1 Tax=Streptomyces TaxID=1883 RepID=UPI0033CFDE22
MAVARDQHRIDVERPAPGSLSEFHGSGLPMLPQDVEAHYRRQAELGRQYARETTVTSAA